MQARICEEHKRRNDGRAEQGDQENDLQRVTADRRGSAALRPDGAHHPFQLRLLSRMMHSASFGKKLLIERA